MNIDLYKQSILNLSKALELPNPLYINDTLRVSLVLQDPEPLVLNILYNTESEQVILDCPLSHSLPISLDEVQKMMSKLMPALLNRNKNLGSLVADPDSEGLNLIKRIDIKEMESSFLADFVPLFVQEASAWRKKVAEVMKSKKETPGFKEEEILNFSYQIS